MPSPTYTASEPLERGALPPDQEKVAAQAEGLEKELHELKARFDQFFLGIERKNPSREADDVRSRLVNLKSAFIRNTALKFRVQSLYQKFLAYERLWQRTLKEMEEGTYRRDILRLRHKNERKKLEANTPSLPKARKGRADAAGEDASFEILEDLADLESGAGADGLDVLPGPPPPAARQPTGTPLIARPAADGGTLVARQPTGSPPAARQPTGLPSTRQAARTPAPAARIPNGGGAPFSTQATDAPALPDSAPHVQEAALVRQATLSPRAPVALPQTSTGSIPIPIREPGGAQAAGQKPGGLPLGDQKLKAIYDAYVTAKKRCRENTAGITFEAVAQSLRRQVPALLKQRGVTSVDFKVVIKNGKAVLKLVPK
jgi:hypothetical protein